MCGIFGYLFTSANGQQQVSTDTVLMTVLAGLKKLEYRGYDSAGG
jgi:glucosamine 6-phosphate synthetase-like amidotransferase/phosphosugar isomerase protein